MRTSFLQQTWRTIVLFLLVQAVVALSPLAAQAFKVGFFTLEPHSMLVNGKPGGSAVEYLRDHIAPEMGADVEFEGPFPFTRLLFDFKAGAYDAILLLAWDMERALRYSYPSEPFGYMESTLLVTKGFPFQELTSSEQLDGLIIGYANKAWRTPFMRDKSIQFDMVTTGYATDTNFNKFDDYRLDGVYNPDKNSLLYSLEKHSLKRPYKLLAVPGEKVGFYTVFHPSTPRSFIRRYEEALRTIQKTLPYERLVEKFLPQ